MSIFDLPLWQLLLGFSIVANYIFMMGQSWLRLGKEYRSGQLDTDSR